MPSKRIIALRATRRAETGDNNLENSTGDNYPSNPVTPTADSSVRESRSRPPLVTSTTESHTKLTTPAMPSAARNRKHSRRNQLSELAGARPADADDGPACDSRGPSRTNLASSR